MGKIGKGFRAGDAGGHKSRVDGSAVVPSASWTTPMTSPSPRGAAGSAAASPRAVAGSGRSFVPGNSTWPPSLSRQQVNRPNELPLLPCLRTSPPYEHVAIALAGVG
jgi:hypothetical protein